MDVRKEMVLELMDFGDFLYQGGLFIVLTMALVLFGIQIYAAFVLWRRGQGEYKLKFFILLTATLIVLFGLLGDLPFVGAGGSSLIYSAVYMLFVLIPVAAIFLIVVYIRDKRHAKEDKA